VACRQNLRLSTPKKWILSYYGILRADAVVVPVNPMNLTQEFRRCVQDARATTVVVSQELYSRIEPLIGVADLELPREGST
jgi:fatty-acyl-CoA synthase